MGLQTKRIFEFGSFRLDEGERQLLRNGEPIPLTPKAFETLVALVENSGHAVDKDALMQRVWPDAIVEEATLAQNIRTLRKALDESPSERQYIETVPKHGYRFVAAVRQSLPEEPDWIIKRHSRSLIVSDVEEINGDLGVTAAERPAPELEATAVPARMKMGARSRIIWLFAAVCLLAIVAAGVLRVGLPHPKQAQQTGPRTIAVLPFSPISAEGQDEFLELGMADALITRLSNIKEIVVRPTSAVRQYSNPDRDPIAAGRELKVQSVLDGSVQKIADRVRVTVRLIDVQDGRPLWAYECNERYADIFELQDSISERIAGALALTLTADEKKLLARRYTDNTETYQLYLKGRYFWNKRTIEGIRKSIEYYDHALEKDPGYAPAYAGLADSYIILGAGPVPTFDELPMKETHPKARTAALKALEIDNTLADAHTALACVMSDYDWDWAEAERQYRQGIELNPNYATGHQWFGEYEAGMGRFDEAVAEMAKAQEIDPLSLIINADLGMIFYWAHRPDQAIEQLQKTIEMDPNFGYAHTYLGHAYAQKGMYDEAVTEYLEADVDNGLSQNRIAALRKAYKGSGWRGFLRKELDDMSEDAGKRSVAAFEIATIYARLSEPDQAFRWLQTAIEERSCPPLYLTSDPRLDGLRSDPRFGELLRRVGLARE